jgi:predicted dehydrogenase
MNIDLLEQVGYWHFAHSFVRGNWRREDESTFVLLAKSCHDMDFLSWIAGRPCLNVSSVGTLSHFRPERAPAGARERCDQDCPVKDCAFDARKIYSPGTPGWDMFVRVRAEVMGESLERAAAALVAGPFGRCVYHSDNTVADHQSVLLEFEGGLNATFTLSAFTNDCARKLRVQGTEGELEMQEFEAGQRLRWRRFGLGKEEELFLPLESGSHGGADFRMVGEWLKSLKGGSEDLILSNAQASLESHRIAFAAEVSRKLGRSLSLEAFEALSEKAYA